MKQIAITEFKKMAVKDIMAALPMTITSDGEAIGIIAPPLSPVKQKTQCPNCKLVYETQSPDGKAFFFSTQHPH